MNNETLIFSICQDGKLTVNENHDLEMVGFKDIIFGTVFLMKNKFDK